VSFVNTIRTISPVELQQHVLAVVLAALVVKHDERLERLTDHYLNHPLVVAVAIAVAVVVVVVAAVVVAVAVAVAVSAVAVAVAVV
jgi:hypothetical protein